MYWTFPESSLPATARQDYIIQSPPSAIHASFQHSLPLFPGATMRLQIALGRGKPLICARACEQPSEKGLPPFALRFCCTSTGLCGMSSCSHNDLPSRAISGCNDRSIQGSGSKYLIHVTYPMDAGKHERLYKKNTCNRPHVQIPSHKSK